jgi:galactose mutarotase-like enzyme
MKTLANNFAVRQLQGFEVFVLANEDVELAVVPALGAKIISLKNLRTGREWLWHPQAGLKLFQNQAGADFSHSPLVGIDECFPTIASCSWRERELPDHGELWNTPWTVDQAAWEKAILKTRVRLTISPFTFERTIELQGNVVSVSYKLNNFGASEESFVWAIHPLLRLQPADQLELPDSTRELLPATDWLDAVESVIPKTKQAKIFAMPVSEGFAAIANQETGDRLEFAWNPAENNALGLWLTRGGWHGHHHFALEVTNGDTDTLATAGPLNRCGVIAPAANLEWQLELKLGSRI